MLGCLRDLCMHGDLYWKQLVTQCLGSNDSEAIYSVGASIELSENSNILL